MIGVTMSTSDLLSRAVNARLRALRKMRGDSKPAGRGGGEGRVTAGAGQQVTGGQVHPGVVAAMSLGAGAESRLSTIATSARVFCNELFESRSILQELRQDLIKKHKEMPDFMYVEKMDLKRKIEFVNKTIEDVCSGKMSKTIESKISSYYMSMQEVLKRTSDALKSMEEESATPGKGIQPIPHSKRVNILSVAVDAEGASKLKQEAQRQKLGSATGAVDPAVADRIIAELGVQLGVQKQEVSAVETDSCACGASMLRSIDKSLMVCSSADCGRVRRIIETTASGPGVDDSDTGVANTRRSTSIKDFLHKWQAIDRIEIPLPVKKQIAKFIYNDLGVKHESQLTYRHVVSAVFELKLSRDMFDHISQIWSELSGQPPPQLTFNESQMITSMWRFVQDKFSTIAANHSKFFFFPLIIERFCRFMNFDSVVDFLVPVYSRPSDASTFHAIQAIFDERGYKSIPPPHVYFLHNTSSINTKIPIPNTRPIITKNVGRAKQPTDAPI
jgi:hypothetical protein